MRNSYKNNKKLSSRKSNEKKFVNHIARRNIKNSWKKSRNINTKTTFKEDEEEFKRVIHKKEVLALTDTNKLKHAFHVPITCNGHECLAMIDTGASHSFVSSNLCQSLKWIVHRSSETINLAENGITTKQRGILKNTIIKCGSKVWRGNLGVMNLQQDISFLLGRDLFDYFGFGLTNVPAINDSEAHIVYEDIDESEISRE